jgi:hypothetical protein
VFSSDVPGANSSDASGTTAFGYDVVFGSPIASVLMTSPLLIVVDSNSGRKGIADNDSNSPHLKRSVDARYTLTRNTLPRSLRVSTLESSLMGLAI